ncbi:hypothetical protein N2W54_000606 [Lotmaria passim]
MTRLVLSLCRRTFLCATLFILVVAIAVAFVTAQEQPPAEAASEAPSVPIHVVDEVVLTEAAVIVDAPSQDEEAHTQADDTAAVQQQQEKEEAAAAATADAVAAEAAAANDGDAAVNAEAEAAAAQAAQAAAEAEARRQQQAEEEEARRQQQAEEEEARRQQQAEEEEARRQQQAEEEEARRRQAEEEEARRRQAEEEARRRKAEEEERQHREAEEHRRRKEEAAARRAAEERSRRELDTVDQIRYSAKELKEGCASLVEKYLFRVHEERQSSASAVSETRAKLNDARVNAPEQVAALEKRLADAQDALWMYDIHTLRSYGGNLPKTCIAEGQDWFESQPDVNSENTYVLAYTHFYRLIVAHLYTMYRTGEGLVHYLMHAYAPALASFTATASDYQNKAWAIYEELFPATGSRPEMPVGQLAKHVATMAGYAAVPLGLGVAAGVISIVALPPVAAGVLVYEYLYKIWAELFIFYYNFGMKLPEGLVAVAKTSVENVKAGEWKVLGSRATDAFFDLVMDSDKIFYNGLLAVFLLAHVVMVAIILMCVWCRCCVPGMRSRKSKKSPLRTSKGKGATPAASAKKSSMSPVPTEPKRTSPAPVPAEKKKS